MAAGEDEAEAFVGDRSVVHRLRVARDEQLRLLAQGALAADPVDRAVACDGHEPAGGIGGHAVGGPPLEGDGDGLLKGVLGEVEVAEDVDQGREDASVLLAEELLERASYAPTSAVRETTGRTSMCPMRADGSFAAHSSASSRLSTSMR